jgi:hypothetical protein
VAAAPEHFEHFESQEEQFPVPSVSYDPSAQSHIGNEFATYLQVVQLVAEPEHSVHLGPHEAHTELPAEVS